MKIKFYSTLTLIGFIELGQAQTVTVKNQNEKVKGENIAGFATELDGKLNDVSQAWNKYLKEIGHAKLFSSDPIVITDPVLDGRVYPKGILYANIFENANQTRVWLGLHPKEWEEKEVDRVNQQLEKLVYQFGIRFNRDKVQKQIDETQEAADAVEKQKQRLINQNKDMTIQLANNEKERIQLEKSVTSNKLESEALKIKLDNNKKAQDSLANVTIQIQKVKESHQERLRKIN